MLLETMLRELGPIQEDWSREVGLLKLGGEAKEGKGLSNPAGWRVVETNQMEVSTEQWVIEGAIQERLIERIEGLLGHG